jgi:hypothetical protein
MKFKCTFKESYEVKQKQDFSTIQEVIRAASLWTRFEKVELQDGGSNRFIIKNGDFTIEVDLEISGWS